MGDSIGDILYLLMMVGALIFSVIRKSRSAEHKGDVIPEDEAETFPSEAFPPFNEWLEKEIPQEETQEYQNKPEVQPMQAEKLQHKKLQYKRPQYQSIKTSDSLKRPERITRITRKPAHENLAENINSYNYTSVWDNESLDLRKAIIYSEIIKRPTI